MCTVALETIRSCIGIGQLREEYEGGANPLRAPLLLSGSVSTMVHGANFGSYQRACSFILSFSKNTPSSESSPSSSLSGFEGDAIFNTCCVCAKCGAVEHIFITYPPTGTPGLAPCRKLMPKPRGRLTHSQTEMQSRGGRERNTGKTGEKHGEKAPCGLCPKVVQYPEASAKRRNTCRFSMVFRRAYCFPPRFSCNRRRRRSAALRTISSENRPPPPSPLLLEL